MICNQCGAQNNDGAKFCTKCGNRLSDVQNQNMQQHDSSNKPEQQNWNQPEQQMQQNWNQSQQQSQQNWNQQQQFQQAGEFQQSQQAQKKSKGPIIAVIIILAVAIIGVAAFLAYQIIVVPILNHRSEETEVVSEVEEIDEETEEVETEVTEEENDEVDVISLLNDQLNQDISARGNLIGSEVDLITMDTWENFDESGIMGVAIVDLNGDGQDELIEVYLEMVANDYGSYNPYVYADIFAVEDSEAIKLADHLILNDGIGFDEQDTCIYLKQNGSGYNLVGDTYAMYWHWADGGNWQMYAYDCTNLEFDQLASCSMSGSSWDDDAPSINLQAGRAAGLDVIEGLSYGPMLLQDNDIFMICNISNTVIQDYQDYYNDNGLIENMTYGTMRFVNMTDSEYALSDSLTEAFLEEEETRYTSDETGEYILPDSADRLLIRDDLYEIAGDADLLKKARNEIYARYGRKFKDPDLQAYFDSKAWYIGYIEPDDFDEDMLSETEKANRDLIVEMEKEVK